MKKIISLFMVVLMIFSVGHAEHKNHKMLVCRKIPETVLQKQKSQMEGYLRLNKDAMYWWYIFHGQIMLF